MNILKNKMGKKSGFTLVEMLIVVAIIAILIAISIPLVSSALESARDRTDQANERSAKAEALIIYLDAGKTDANKGVYADLMGATTATGYSAPYAVYDAVAGKLVQKASKPTTGYGQCAKKDDTGFAADTLTAAPGANPSASTTTYPSKDGGHKDCVLCVQCTADGDVVLSWVPLTAIS